MSVHSLRLRLLLGAGAWIAVALFTAGVVIVLIFASSIAQDEREDLLASLDRVLVSASTGGKLGSLQPGLGDPR